MAVTQSSNNTTPETSACDRVIVFTRYPIPGQTKTRLIPALGPQGAARLHARLVAHTLETVLAYCRVTRCELTVQITGGSVDEMRRSFGEGLHAVVQQGDSLGDRIHHAAMSAFTEGSHRVVIIGTDSPDLQTEHLAAAFDALRENDLVLGPAMDGGFYLIGMKESQPQLYHDVAWGTDTVLMQILKNADQLRKSYRLLQQLSDIDYPEDLLVCRRLPQTFDSLFPSATAGLLSVIIPTLNEEATIAPLIRQLRVSPEIEVIVVDGGSSDRTVEIASQAGASVIRCNMGRGRQMNAGAAMARGDLLLFLHADVKLPDNFLECIKGFRSTDRIAGTFRLRIDDPHWLYRIVEFGANLRSSWLNMPYGDQGLFLRSETFFELCGFQQWPLLEDLEFSRRLGKRGRFFIAKTSLGVSARRWNRMGVIRATLLNQLIVIAYYLGVSPDRLAKLYAGRKKNS